MHTLGCTSCPARKVNTYTRAQICRMKNVSHGYRFAKKDRVGRRKTAAPTSRPPAVSLLAKITSHILQLNKSWRAARRLGQSLVASSCLLCPCSRSLPMQRHRPILHVSLMITLRQTLSIPELLRHPNIAHVPKCTRLHLCSLSGQRYVMRVEEGEPGNEAKVFGYSTTCIPALCAALP